MPSDISRLRRAAPISASSAYEMLVLAVVDLAIYMVDLGGYVASWSPGAERITGYTADEIMGRHFGGLYPHEDRVAGAPTRNLRIAADTGRYAAEGWRLRKNGQRFWASVAIDPIRQDGELVGFAKVTRDMTEQREAIRAQVESERRFRLLVEGVTDYAIFMLDQTGHVTNWNAGARRIKGYREHEIVGQHFSRFYRPADIEAGVPAASLETARREGRFAAEGWRVRKDGSEFWASVALDAIYDGTELVGFAKITRDLTDRREHELRLEHSRMLLAQSQRLDAVGQLTSGIANDFNNLLTGISGNLEILAARLSAGRTAGLEVQIVAAQQSAARATALTHGLLAFSRRQTLDPKPLSANALIERLQPLIRRAIGEQVELVLDLAENLWPTYCDAGQLEASLMNVVVNAREAMGGAGRLRFETANVTVAEDAAGLDDMTPGHYVCIAVQDTGSGMSEEVAARAFEPFYTTKFMGGGTGLGLSIVHGFARQSGGQVRLQSRLGEGTTLQLLLPRQIGPPVTAIPTPLEGPSAASDALVRTTPLKILVVDDEATVRLLVRDMLEDLDHIVLEAEDGPAALRVFEAEAPLDLLISDVGMPGMNGRQLAETVRSRQADLKVLFITGYAENKVLDPSRLEPGMDVLTKPFAMQALTSRIDALVSR